MPHFKHAVSGRVISRKAGSRLVDGWEEIDPEVKKSKQEKIAEYETVKDLKRDADKKLRAKTVRGSYYEYLDGEWRKVDE